MKNLALLLTSLSLLTGLWTKAQESDSAFAMLSKTAATNDEAEKLIETEAAIAKKNKTTKHANFRANKAHQNLNQYIKENLAFPDEARVLGKTGLVKAAFDILPDGSIDNIEVLESPLDILSDGLIKTLQTMPYWSPAYQNGTAIKTRQQIHVDFSLF